MSSRPLWGTLKLYDLVKQTLGTEKGVDTQLASDMITLSDGYDVAVVVSGDADYSASVRKREQFVDKRTQQGEVDRNYEAFKAILPELMRSDANRFALMHDGEVVACFDTSRDASQAGKQLFENDFFSVQKVTVRPVDLGYFSHAGVRRAV